MLSGLHAILDGEDIFSIEEIARMKHDSAEIEELQQTIREHAATLEAYVLLHDVAKPSTIAFNAPKGSGGEREGYRQTTRDWKHASTKEVETYNKLVKKFLASHPEVHSKEQLVASFYDELEITVHYRGHDRMGAGDAFLPVRELVCDALRLPSRDRALVTWCIRNHIDALSFFSEGPNPDKYELLLARSDKAGFDADDALDLLLAAVFLDAVVGGAAYRHGEFFVDLNVFTNFLRSEELAKNERREARRARMQATRIAKMKEMLKEAGLHAEDVFTLLGTPFGQERGLVLARLQKALRDQSYVPDFKEQSEEMIKRIRKAQERFDPNTMSWEDARANV